MGVRGRGCARSKGGTKRLFYLVKKRNREKQCEEEWRGKIV